MNAEMKEKMEREFKALELIGRCLNEYADRPDIVKLQANTITILVSIMRGYIEECSK